MRLRTLIEHIDDFRSWFGSSKIVDAQGKPVLLYHGTTHMDEIVRDGFKPGWTHLSDSKPVADSYQQWKRGSTPGTLAVYAKVENPAYYDAKGQKYTDIGHRIFRATYDAERAGHDGMIIKNIRDHYDSGVPTRPHMTVIVFRPDQIRRATTLTESDAVHFEPYENYWVHTNPVRIVKVPSWKTHEDALSHRETFGRLRGPIKMGTAMHQGWVRVQIDGPSSVIIDATDELTAWTAANLIAKTYPFTELNIEAPDYRVLSGRDVKAYLRRRPAGL